MWIVFHSISNKVCVHIGVCVCVCVCVWSFSACLCYKEAIFNSQMYVCMYVYVVHVCVVFLCSPLLQEAVSIARCVCVCVLCVVCVCCVCMCCVCVCGLSLPPFAARKLFQYPGVCVRCMVCVCVCVWSCSARLCCRKLFQ